MASLVPTKTPVSCVHLLSSVLPQVDTAEAEQLLRQGLGRRGIRPEKQRDTSGSGGAGDTDMLSNGIQGYNELTQSSVFQKFKKFFNMTIVPVFLISFVPNLVILIWYTIMHCDGSYAKMAEVFHGSSILEGLRDIWSLVSYPTAPIVWIFVGYCVYALAMMKILPGKTVHGPLTSKGNVPVYKDNGFLHYLVTVALFWTIAICLRPYGLSPTIIYDRFDQVLFLLNIFSLVFCALLYLKGRFSPSSTDSGSSGNLIFDYYWGMELYPRVLGFDIKVFTNCRFGMTVWALLVCVHALKSYELHGFVDSMFVSAFLNLLYITKFFWWEAGYLSTIDIMVDRAGFYICWGCLVFVPGFYTSPTYYMVSHPVHLGPILTLSFLLLGALSIYINFAADDQKQAVRSSGGECLIWGKKPEVIRAKYQLETGEVKESLLLASGWWGMSRHFHYIPEILLAFFWSVPALGGHVMPYSYTIWLVILLSHRSFRDDTKCRNKYGKFWQQYCKKVPQKIVPYVF